MHTVTVVSCTQSHWGVCTVQSVHSPQYCMNTVTIVLYRYCTITVLLYPTHTYCNTYCTHTYALTMVSHSHCGIVHTYCSIVCTQLPCAVSHTMTVDETSSCTLKEMMDWQGTRSAVVHIHSLSCGGSELCLRSQQLQPTRKSTNIPHKKPKAWLPCLDHMRNSIATKQKYWWIPNKTFKRSHGTCALMRREISGHQTRQITFIWMLQANSSHHAFHQLTQYVVIFRPKACVTIQVGEAVLWTQHGTL